MTFNLFDEKKENTEQNLSDIKNEVSKVDNQEISKTKNIDSNFSNPFDTVKELNNDGYIKDTSSEEEELPTTNKEDTETKQKVNQFSNHLEEEQKEDPIKTEKKNIFNKEDTETTKEITPQESQQIFDMEKIEETVEKIVNEKWDEVLTNVKKIVSWKEDVDVSVSDIKKNVEDIQEEFRGFQKKVLLKVEAYDSNILDINSDLKAFEKVFQKILPTFVNNVTELTKITETFKDNMNLRDK